MKCMDLLYCLIIHPEKLYFVDFTAVRTNRFAEQQCGMKERIWNTRNMAYVLKSGGVQLYT